MTDTVADMIRAARDALSAAGIESAARDARQLVALALGQPADRLTLVSRDPVEQADWHALDDLLPQRVARRPMSHLTGRRAFWRSEFEVTPDVLDPRPETEMLVRAALEGPISRVLDLGTGSGAIVLSLLMERPAATGLATDLCEGALAVAGRNAARLGLADRVDLLRSDWFGAVSGTFDLIVSNPPYIAADEMAGLAPELSYEPRMALSDEADGLTAYRAIAAGASAHLTPGGRLLVEIGPSQAEAVTALFAAAGLHEIAVIPDLDGRDRVVAARAI